MIGMLMPTPELLTEYDRMQKFMPGENSLDAFCSAGFLSKQHNRMKAVVVATEEPWMKMALYNEYISCCGRQGMSVILNGNLHSSSTLYAARYIELVKDVVCQDLRALVAEVYNSRINKSSTIQGRCFLVESCIPSIQGSTRFHQKASSTWIQLDVTY
jgi:hypothetical protein